MNFGTISLLMHFTLVLGMTKAHAEFVVTLTLTGIKFSEAIFIICKFYFTENFIQAETKANLYTSNMETENASPRGSTQTKGENAIILEKPQKKTLIIMRIILSR